MNKIADENYFDLLVNNNTVERYRNNNEDSIFSINPRDSLVVLKASRFNMCEIGTYPYAFFPSLFTLNAEFATNSNIEKVQSNPNLALFGQGVLVAVIDTGIDYQHPAFKYADNSTRIHSLWDQTINENNGPPANFYYGMEYTKEMINTALRDENPLNIVPSIDEVGHGTMVAGIIGGSSNEQQQFRGVVPQCEFVIVKLKPAKKLNKQIFCVPEDRLCYEETDVIAGLTYVTNVAQNLHRPLSICIAMGTSQGGHNGKGATSGYLDYLTQTPSIGVSVAGGNEANKRRHFLGNIISPYYTDIELLVSEEDPSFAMEIWAASPYRLSMDITTPTGETISNLYPRINECRKLDFILTPSTVYVNNIISESDTGDQLVLIRFQQSISGIWRFRIYSIDQEEVVFHSWLPAENLISENTYFLNPNPETTVTSPGNADSPLTVANYNSTTEGIVNSSGKGYTRYDVIKPDLAAPGYNITCPIPNNQYTQVTGTGASAAHSTGIMAIILEWAVVKGQYTGITGSEMNKMLIRGAYRLEEIDYPNRSWGYGAMDIFGLFEKLT